MRIIATLLLGTAVAFAADLQDAKAAFDAGDYRKAQRLFEQAYAKSKRCDILHYLGLTRYRLGEPNEAIITFKTAIECDPKLVPAHVALAEAYGARGNDAEALTAYLQALNHAPANVAALRGASAIYLATEDNAHALPLLQSLVKLLPKDPQAHIDVAAAYAATGDRDKAEHHFLQALRINPNVSSALMGLGNAYLKKGQESDAIALLQKASAAAPRAYEPHYLLGAAYNRLNKPAEALAELEAALTLGGNDPEIHYHLARAHGALGHAEERRLALAKFADLTRKAKQNTESQRRALRLVDEAKSLIETGSLEAAVARLEEARELRSGDATLLFRLAGLHFDLQRFDIARNYVQEAISLTPSVWVHHYLLGLIEQKAQRWPQARASLEMAARLNASAAEVHNALGLVSLELRDNTRAIQCFRRASELAPNDPAYRLNLDAAKSAR